MWPATQRTLNGRCQRAFLMLKCRLARHQKASQTVTALHFLCSVGAREEREDSQRFVGMNDLLRRKRLGVGRVCAVQCNA